MSQAASAKEYAALTKARSKIEGRGVDTRMTIPCPFCAAEDFAAWRIVEFEKVMAEPHACKECGRSAKCVFSRTPDGGRKVEMVQTGGPDQPKWLKPKMRRIE